MNKANWFSGLKTEFILANKNTFKARSRKVILNSQSFMIKTKEHSKSFIKKDIEKRRTVDLIVKKSKNVSIEKISTSSP